MAAPRHNPPHADSDDDSDAEPVGTLSRAEAVRPRRPVRRVGRARARRPRSVEDRGRDVVRHRATKCMQRGDLLTPNLAGEPFVDRPPLVYALAAADRQRSRRGSCRAHDAARLAAGAAARAHAAAARARPASELNGRKFRWMPVLLFVGSVGLVGPRAPAVARARAAARNRRRALRLRARAAASGRRRRAAGPRDAGSHSCRRGFLGPLWLVVTALALPARLRGVAHARYATTVAVALAIALPLCARVAARACAARARASRRLVGAQSSADYFAPLSPTATGRSRRSCSRTCSWFAWPALPLVLWTLWTRGRGFNGGLATPASSFPARSRS